MKIEQLIQPDASAAWFSSLIYPSRIEGLRSARVDSGVMPL
jgi:hypothetical protein